MSLNPLKIRTLRELLTDLCARGFITEDRISAIASVLTSPKEEERSPWFIMALQALGAWIASAFLFGFIYDAGWCPEERLSVFFVGLVLIAAATGLRSLIKYVFFVQLALAWSVTGHAFVLIAAGWNSGPASVLVPVAAGFLCPVLYVLYRDSIHRFLSTILVTASTTTWLILSGNHHWLHLLILVETGVTGLIFVRCPLSIPLRPLGYAFAVSLLVTPFLVLMPMEQLNTVWWPSNLVLTVAALALYAWIAGNPLTIEREPLIFVVLATVALGFVSTPGLLAAIGLMVLGYALYEKLLLGLGLVFLPLYLVVYYYDLKLELAYKSWVLVASGSTLLLVRWYLSRRPWTQEEA